MSSDESGTPAPVSDLMAVAIIRRILLELGHDPLEVGPSEAMWSVEVWMHHALAALAGLNPLQALQGPNGLENVRLCLVALVASSSGPGPTARPCGSNVERLAP